MIQTHSISVIRTVPELRGQTAAWRDEDERIALVPTMGALHEGHLTLVRRALETCNRVIVSLFINPTQFEKDEDLSVYPHDEVGDIEILEELGIHVLYAPTMEEMYPDGFATSVRVSELTEGLCGAFRPVHFAGVATVVTKLMLQSLPDVAVFGEKDYQQLQIIRRLARDLDIPVLIDGVPTVREKDGLAFASRNAYLSPRERVVAPSLFKVLQKTATCLQTGEEVQGLMEAGKRELLKDGFSKIDYFEVCDAETLKPVSHIKAAARVLAAAYLGKTRLIDNHPVVANMGG
jgi:pantoate--beta-alanine ligase